MASSQSNIPLEDDEDQDDVEYRHNRREQGVPNGRYASPTDDKNHNVAKSAAARTVSSPAMRPQTTRPQNTRCAMNDARAGEPIYRPREMNPTATAPLSRLDQCGTQPDSLTFPNELRAATS